MLTIKKRRRALQILAVISMASLTACGPAGPRDLRKGERLIAKGQYAEAIPVLNEGVQLLRAAPANVQATAWNLLGLACHGAGQPDAAARAYLEALKLDRNLWAADYNLGCLHLEQTNYPGAIDSLSTYTTLHPKDLNGYLLLGRARLQSAMEHPGTESNRRLQLENARLDYEYAEKLHSTAEACNALGIIELQRRNPGSELVRASVDYFKRALQREPHYPPAILNLAIVLHRYMNEPQAALDKYREYLALQPAPPQAQEVESLAHQLDLDLRITIVPHPLQRPAPTAATPTNSRPQEQITAPVETPVHRPAPSATTKATVTEKPAASTQIPTPPANPPPASSPPPQSLAQSSPPPVTKPNPPSAPANPNATVTDIEVPAVNPPEEKKKSLVQKLNPLNWFSKSKKTNAAETAVSAEAGSAGHYNYPLYVTPIPGDRKMAEQLTSQGHLAEHQSNRTEAMRDYQDAMKADPTYFEAGLALGLAAIDAKAYPTALDALGQAVAIRPNSADARYAFAWALGRQGYYQDAANELDKLLTTHPSEVRAHLLLGNFYSDNLAQPQLAREQYLKALALLDPQSTQAATIRVWLDQHP